MILIVEDDADIAVGLRALLMSEGATVRIAASGSEALDETARERPDVIVLDLQLPDGGGAQTYEQISRRWPRLPVVFVSGADDLGEIAHHLANDYAAFLFKPFEFDQLLSAIEKVTSAR